jgi:hypothetical protein
MLALREAPSQEALADHNDNQPQQIRQAGGYCSLDPDGLRRVADGLLLGSGWCHVQDDPDLLLVRARRDLGGHDRTRGRGPRGGAGGWADPPER